MDLPLQTPATAPPNPMLLEQLRDVATPVPVSWWPPAPGWWLVAAIALAAVYFVLRFLRARWRADRYRKEAIDLLADLEARWQQDRDTQAYAQGAHRILRRVAIEVAGRDEVAGLTGPRFIDRVNDLSAATLSTETGRLLTETSYRPTPETGERLDLNGLRDEMLAWLENLARPRRA